MKGIFKLQPGQLSEAMQCGWLPGEVFRGTVNPERITNSERADCKSHRLCNALFDSCRRKTLVLGTLVTQNYNLHDEITLKAVNVRDFFTW